MNEHRWPSLLFYVVGLVMVITAMVILAVNLGMTVNQYNLQKRYIKIPGINTVVFEEVGDYVAYYEPKATFEEVVYDTTSMNLPEIRVHMTKLKESEEYPFEVARDDGFDLLFFRTGNPVFRFTVKEPGALVFNIDYVSGNGPDAILNVTKDNIDVMYNSFVSSVILSGAMAALGVVLVIVTFFLRIWSLKKHYDEKKFKG